MNIEAFPEKLAHFSQKRDRIIVRIIWLGLKTKKDEIENWKLKKLRLNENEITKTKMPKFCEDIDSDSTKVSYSSPLVVNHSFSRNVEI